MADNMSKIEQAGKPQSQKVAERWLKIRGIKQPHEAQPVQQGEINSPTSLIQEAYDLFVERQELRDQIVGSERRMMEPKDKNQSTFGAILSEWDDLLSGRASEKVLSLDDKRELIKQGKI